MITKPLVAHSSGRHQLHKDEFDVALLPGKREELAAIYRLVRSSEDAVLRDMRDGRENLNHLFETVEDCPACGARAGDAKLMYTKDGMEVVRCQTCDFIFSRHVFSLAYDQSRYADEANENLHLKLKTHATYAALEMDKCAYVVQTIGSFSARPGALLDIGSSTGMLLHQARDAGWQAYGIEASPIQVAFTQKNGLTVAQGYFPEVIAEFPRLGFPEKFDAVCMLDVLEHMLQPKDFLTHLHDVLRHNGIVCIQVPNIDSLLIRLEGSRNSTICAGHWSYFSAKTLVDLMADSGFKPLHVETYISELDRTQHFPIDAINRAYADVTGKPRTSTERPDADEVHAALMGYKVFGLFQATDR